MEFDRSRTLEDLEGKYWGEPDEDEGSYVITTAHALRHKPLSDFTAEDLRFMIGQEIGLEYLVPVALDMLSDNPLASGDIQRGDLLLGVLSVNRQFWLDHQELIMPMENVLLELDSIKRFIERDVAAAASAGFRTIYYE